jgi:calcium/calmodulin-dependent protein kinase I
MGNCPNKSCFDAAFSSEYQTLPDVVEEEDYQPKSTVSTSTSTHSCDYGTDNSASEGTGNASESMGIVFPEQFGKFYSIGALVGIGTTSKVYCVERTSANISMGDSKPLACKIIDKRVIIRGVDDPDIDPLLDQISKEVAILKRIHHPNIVSFYDYMETRHKLFIITERLEGGELFEYILDNGPLKESFARTALYGAFSAVSYLHARGVVHRDIKAENLIFFTDERGETSLKLIDFGFSTILRHELTGSFMGTGGYIAPEIRQFKNYSTSVDSWSLGVLLYCALSAKLPFGISLQLLPSSMEECREAFTLTFPDHPWAGISRECKDLISKLLEIDPIKRLTAHEAVHHAWVSSMCMHMLLLLSVAVVQR